MTEEEKEEKEGKKNQKERRRKEKEEEKEEEEEEEGRRGKKSERGEGRREEKKEGRNLIGLRMWLSLYGGLPSTHKAPGSNPSPASRGQRSTCLSSQHSKAEAGRSQVGGQPELQARSYLEKK